LFISNALGALGKRQVNQHGQEIWVPHIGGLASTNTNLIEDGCLVGDLRHGRYLIVDGDFSFDLPKNPKCSWASNHHGRCRSSPSGARNYGVWIQDAVKINLNFQRCAESQIRDGNQFPRLEPSSGIKHSPSPE
jgi:hypothetical protein